MIIPWDQLKDFMQREQYNLKFLCKLIYKDKGAQACNPPNTLTHPGANFVSLKLLGEEKNNKTFYLC